MVILGIHQNIIYKFFGVNYFAKIFPSKILYHMVASHRQKFHNLLFVVVAICSNSEYIDLPCSNWQVDSALPVTYTHGYTLNISQNAVKEAM